MEGKGLKQEVTTPCKDEVDFGIQWLEVNKAGCFREGEQGSGRLDSEHRVRVLPRVSGRGNRDPPFLV